MAARAAAVADRAGRRVPPGVRVMHVAPCPAPTPGEAPALPWTRHHTKPDGSARWGWRTCKGCGVPFKARSAHHAFHSKACRLSAGRNQKAA